MRELLDRAPDAAVRPDEYHRLLGYPRDRELTERAHELSAMAHEWYATNGRPWVHARYAEQTDITPEHVIIDGEVFTSRRLQQTLRDADAYGTVIVAASAGPELEAEAQRRWADEKPDEYFFLEVYGSAVVEHLVASAGARLCAAAEQEGAAVLPHYSPGYPEWDIAEQGRLLRAWRHPEASAALGPIDVMESGMLRPKKSMLAVFGLTRQVDRVRKLSELVPCERCALPRCQFRRARNHRPPSRAMVGG